MNANQKEKGSINAVSLLDLRQMKSIDELSNITRINAVGLILISDAFKGTLAGIPMNAVGSIITLPEGCKVNHIGGTMKIGGEFLENPSVDGSDILLVTGELLIISPITKFGYKQLIVTGQLFVPRGSENVLTPFITQTSGEIIPYDHINARMFVGQGTFSQEFFTYLKDPITMILMGEYTMESDVSVEIIKEKVKEIILTGVLKVEDKKLIPILSALAIEQIGVIQVSERVEGMTYE